MTSSLHRFTTPADTSFLSQGAFFVVTGSATQNGDRRFDLDGVIKRLSSLNRKGLTSSRLSLLILDFEQDFLLASIRWHIEIMR